MFPCPSPTVPHGGSNRVDAPQIQLANGQADVAGPVPVLMTGPLAVPYVQPQHAQHHAHALADPHAAFSLLVLPEEL